jgi:hypothetical protein
MSLSLAIVPVIEMGAASLSPIFVLAHQCIIDKPGAAFAHVVQKNLEKLSWN